MRVLLRLALLGLVIVTAGPPCAFADPAHDPAAAKLAKQYVDAGLAAQDAHDYDTAITLYSRAYQLVSHPLLIFNLAQVHRLAGHLDKALVLYRRYLAEDPDGAQATIARGFVDELAEREAARQREFEAAVRSSDAAERQSDPSHKEAGKADPREPAAVRSAAVAEPRPDPPAAPAAPPAAPGDAPVDGSPAPASRNASPWKWALGASAGLTLGGAAFTVYSGTRSTEAARQIHQGVTDSDCGKSPAALGLTSPQDSSAFNHACTWHSREIVGLWVAGVALAASAVSLVMVTREPGAPEPATADHGKHEVAIAPIIAPGIGGASLSVAW